MHMAYVDVRQCQSDMGTGSGIVDYGDVTAACLGQPSPGVGHLYPYALGVPGLHRILDGALHDVLASTDR